MQKEKILLTGATGNLGSWLAAEMLRQGKQVIALMRDKTIEAASNRMDSVLDIAGGTEFSDDIEIVLGDICKENLGLSMQSRKLQNISKIVHCAACTKFSGDSEEFHKLINFQGTYHVLQLATLLSIPLVHVSSAYIAGKRDGVVKEDEIDIGQHFNNIYESTKCSSEMLVHWWTKLHNTPTIILRPSIVLGDSRNGRIVHFNSIYAFMRVLDFIAPHVGDDIIRIAPGTATKNIIPIDYFAQTALHIMDCAKAGTFHITNPVPFSVQDLDKMYSGIFSGNKYEIVNENAFLKEKPSSLEQIIRQVTTTYSSYLTSEPVFDRSNTDAVLKDSDIEFPTMDIEYFGLLVDYARSVRWGRTERSSKVSA